MNTLQITQPLVSINWLSKHLNHPDLIILDATIKKVTSAKETNTLSLKISGSRFFDIKKIFSDLNTDIPNMLPTPELFSKACKELGISNHHTIVVYDKLGIYSSPRVWWMFKSMGHANVAVLDGGFPAWTKANLPCQPSDTIPNYDQGSFTAVFQQELVSNAKDIHTCMYAEDTLIIDARSPGRFRATEPEPRADLKGGHIPNSMNLHYKNVLNETTMKSQSELENILKSFTIGNKKLIFTCGSGITACILMLAAEITGYSKMSIYDGSWSEWGQLNNVLIEK